MKRLAAALLVVLSLSACAVTGQAARPGTAAVLDGRTITNDDVAAWGAAINEMSYSFDPGAVLTLLLLKPTLDAEAARLDFAMADADVDFEARAWMASNKAPVKDRTADMKAVVGTVVILNALLSNEDSAQAIADALGNIEKNASVNPMYGDFSAQGFVDSWTEQVQARTDQSGKLGDVSYLVFKDITGFDVLAQQSWMGDPSEAPAAPAATAPAVP